MNDHILPFKSPLISCFNVEVVLWHFTVTEQRNSKIGAVLKCFGGYITVVVTANQGKVLYRPADDDSLTLCAGSKLVVC